MINVFILNKNTNQLVEAEIVIGTLQEMPQKKEGWGFDWRTEFQKEDTEVFLLKLLSDASVQGVLSLRKEADMLVMDLVEIAPHNKGRENKRYSYVAGCLIAYACKQTFKLEGSYYGYLVFVSKTALIDWYRNNYYAQQAIGQKMFIDSMNGNKLIGEYLNRNKNEK